VLIAARPDRASNTALNLKMFSNRSKKQRAQSPDTQNEKGPGSPAAAETQSRSSFTQALPAPTGVPLLRMTIQNAEDDENLPPLVRIQPQIAERTSGVIGSISFEENQAKFIILPNTQLTQTKAKDVLDLIGKTWGVRMPDALISIPDSEGARRVQRRDSNSREVPCCSLTRASSTLTAAGCCEPTEVRAHRVAAWHRRKSREDWRMGTHWRSPRQLRCAHSWTGDRLCAPRVRVAA